MSHEGDTAPFLSLKLYSKTDVNLITQTINCHMIDFNTIFQYNFLYGSNNGLVRKVVTYDYPR